MTIYILGSLTPLIPLLLIAWLAFGSPESKTEWLLRFLLIGSVVLIFYKSGLWVVSSYYLRFIIAALFVASAIYSFNRHKHLSWRLTGEHWFRIGSTALSALICLALSIFTIAGSYYSANFVSLKFPLSHGNYAVIQGGSNLMTNPFHGMSANGRYALDLVKINRLGNRANSFLPQQLAQHYIFGDQVYSPCKGEVLIAVNDLPDNLPPMTDYQHSAGNHVVIACEGVNVMLAHLRQDSLTATKGDRLTAGQPVGQVGNSGYSDEPHLHIQANRPDGTPVAIRFGEQFFSINDLYTSR